jgi:hypothetical protein
MGFRIGKLDVSVSLKSVAVPSQ